MEGRQDSLRKRLKVIFIYPSKTLQSLNQNTLLNITSFKFLVIHVRYYQHLTAERKHPFINKVYNMAIFERIADTMVIKNTWLYSEKYLLEVQFESLEFHLSLL